MLIQEIEKKLEKVHGEIKFNGNTIYIGFRSVNAGLLPKVKTLLYFLLNRLEKEFFIKIMDIAYCLMPDAADHLSYKARKNKNYTKIKNCLRCRYNLCCPGFCEGFFTKKLNINPPRDAPVDIAIELNNECNLKCRCCLKKRSSGNVALPFETIKKTLEEAKSMGISYVRFTGGEPLLRRDIVKILRYTKQNGFTVFLNTNGFLLDKKKIESIENYVDNILISICGYNSRLEEKLSGINQNLELKFINILRVKNSKIPYVRVGTVISRMLIREFGKYFKLISTLGIKNWEFYRPMLSKHIIKKHEQYNLTKNDFLKLMHYVKRLRNSGMNTYIANAMPFCITKNASLKTVLNGAKFDDGHSRLVLDARGYFKPSYFINKNLGKSIKKAWNHKFIRDINSLQCLPYRCKRCYYLKWCLGGSRYLAKESKGSYFCSDPLME